MIRVGFAFFDDGIGLSNDSWFCGSILLENKLYCESLEPLIEYPTFQVPNTSKNNTFE